MEEESAYSPGTKLFWMHFYSKDGGRLAEKEEDKPRSKSNADGSLMDHYEWFLEYEDYEEPLVQFLREVYVWTKRELRVLHVGCGNSDFCDYFTESVSDVKWNGKPTTVDILNVDICDNVIEHLLEVFPHRQYAVGDCCDLISASCGEGGQQGEEGWFSCRGGTPPRLGGVRPASVDLVFDKGTLDALLSAFPGEYNPNAEAYATQALQCLSTGGCIFIITINCVDLVNTYLLSVSDGARGFSLKYKNEVLITKEQASKFNVETLGQRYSCYGYIVVAE